MLTKQRKTESVNELADKVKSQTVVLFADFHGLSVAKQQELRRALRKEDAEYKVAKKTLLRRAFEAVNLPFSFFQHKGEIGITFGFGDQVSPAKILQKFAKANPESLKILGGLLGGRELSQAEVVALAKLPGKQELLGQLAGVLSSPVRGLMNVLNGNQRNLVVALAQIVKNK